MKIFEIIAGSRAPLYHGTDIINMATIVSEGILNEGVHWGRLNEPHGIRFTRDLRMAWRYAEDSEVNMGSVLIMDQAKLAHRYRIVPYKDVDATGEPAGWLDEMEEVVLAQQIPIAPFLVAILAKVDHVRRLRTPDWADYAISERGYKTPQEYYAALDRLAHHPLLRGGRLMRPV